MWHLFHICLIWYFPNETISFWLSCVSRTRTSWMTERDACCFFIWKINIGLDYWNRNRKPKTCYTEESVSFKLWKLFRFLSEKQITSEFPNWKVISALNPKELSIIIGLWENINDHFLKNIFSKNTNKTLNDF